MFRKLSEISNLKIIKVLLKPEKLILNSKVFQLPNYNLGFYPNKKMSEIWMIDLFENFIPIKTGTFVDVGVNVGQTLLKLRSVGEINYVGFEPNVNCIFYLDKLIKLNNLKNVKIIPVGISDRNTLGALYSYSDDLDSSASILKNFRNTEIKKKWYVPLFDIQTIVKTIQLENISLLKIDVEGTELEVLQSFEKIIRKDLPFILIEVLPVYNEQNKDRLQRQLKLQELINKLGYIICRIIKTKNKVTRLEKLNEIEIHSNLNNCDYLLVPNEAVLQTINSIKQSPL